MKANWQFWRDVVSEEGRASSKRIAFFVLLTVWIAAFIVNLITGKSPSQVFMDQAFYMLTLLLASIIGSNVLNTVKDVKFKQSDNNAKVGAPSPPPTPDTTIVTDKTTLTKPVIKKNV